MSLVTARTISLLAQGGTIDTNGFNSILSGNIINSGSLTKFGAGTLTLSGANTYTGTSSTLSGVISGVGSFTKSGDGILILTGTDNYTGGTTISAGTLQIGNGGTTGSITGNVADNGTLAFDRSDSAIFSGTISGAGGLVQLGTGTLTLTGNNTYSGATNVAFGTLQAGSLTAFSANSAFNVASVLILTGANTYSATSLKAVLEL